MRWIVLDTNVVVSAGISPDGAPYALVYDWILERQVQLVCSPFVLAEYRDVVRRDKFRRYKFPPAWLEVAILESVQLPEPEPWPIECPDPKDAPFLALAKTSGAWLVSGNLKHYPESVCDGVKVVSPSEYLATLEGTS